MTRDTGRPLGIGLVGTGIGRLHALGMARLPQAVRLAAVCAQPLAEASRFAAEHGAVSATDDFQEMLRDPGVEAVDLCVPHHLHMPMALAAAAAGKHILVEKPIARTLEEADAVIAAARDAGVTLMIGHNQRFFGHHRRAKELLEAGAIGAPFMVAATVHVHGHIGSGFRQSLEQAGGGTLIDSGVHRFDLLRWLLGDVETVYAQAGRFLQKQMEGEDCAAVALRFASGAIGTFSCSWSARTPFPNETLEIFGPGGALLAEDHGRTLRLKTDTPRPGMEDVRELSFAIDQAESIRLVIEAFADSVRRGVRPPVTGEDGRAALAVSLACYRSAATGLRVRVAEGSVP